MARSIGKRLGQLALIAFVLYGATFGALFLRGMYYVQPNVDNWRLLPYIVPAASYEHAFAAPNGFDGQQDRASFSISCKDTQGREIEYEAETDSGINTFYHTYTDITRR